ncbi:bifunctional metallophosphatase/5'-nucleotidase [Hazenella coriacea]|uniref:5'-nucleotidase n=1 Tax=Hazenella coriacea TaxID=1179467 RepID=A0A4V2UVI6_9BACL|nr:5'-nucleotidase C-terminal domain-containing protein [Hazenella coriacea]TCS95927.1 5'-nucleotidase [Hazenella coriacea]
MKRILVGLLSLTMLVSFPILTGFSNSSELEIAKKNQTVSVQLLSINDFHGQLDTVGKVNNKPVGTAEYLASYLRQREAENRNTMLLHVGDAVGASAPVSALMQDEPTIKFFNKLGFDLGTIGNHEFDEGVDEMLRLINGGTHPNTGKFKGAKFPYIAANVVDKKTKKPILPTHMIKRFQGVPVGFIGVVTKTTPSIVVPDGVKNVEFIDEAEAVNREVAKLKKKGVKAIIVLAHEGGFQNQTTGEITGPIADITKNLDPEVDVVFAGHSHSYLNGMIDDKLVVQAYSYGTAFADVDIVLDRKTKDIVQKKGEIVTTFHEGMTPDPKIQAFMEKAKKKVAPIIEAEVGQTTDEISRKENEAGESPLGNLIADAQRLEMKTDISFMNPGGIRSDLPAGKVTWGDLYTVQPFSNDLVKMELTGEQIRRVLNQQFQDPNRIRILKVSGLHFTWNPNRSAHDRVVDITQADGTPIDPKQTYTVTANIFLADGGDNFTVFTEGTNRVAGPSDLDALVNYVKQLPQPFSARIEGRIQLSNN